MKILFQIHQMTKIYPVLIRQVRSFYYALIRLSFKTNSFYYYTIDNEEREEHLQPAANGNFQSHFIRCYTRIIKIFVIYYQGIIRAEPMSSHVAPVEEIISCFNFLESTQSRRNVVSFFIFVALCAVCGKVIEPFFDITS